MVRIGGENTGMPTSIRKVVVASFIGTTIEWYDYFIFALASALFFPGFGVTTGTILAYTTFAVGFGARPSGGLIFGHYGDETMLATTLLIMSIATFLVGILPGYDAIGVLAPIIAAILFPIGGATLISVYIAALCVLCYFLAEETFQKDIYEEESEERRLLAEQQG